MSGLPVSGLNVWRSFVFEFLATPHNFLSVSCSVIINFAHTRIDRRDKCCSITCVILKSVQSQKEVQQVAATCTLLQLRFQARFRSVKSKKEKRKKRLIQATDVFRYGGRFNSQVVVRLIFGKNRDLWRDEAK